WLAHNEAGTWRAVKIVRRQNFDNDRPYQRELSGIRRFEPISRGHPSQVAVFTVGENSSDGLFYYVMELADDVRQLFPSRDHHEQAPPIDSIATAAPFDPATYQPKTLR